MTAKQKIIEKLKRDGFVDNFWAIENKATIRLGAVINVLRTEGWKFSSKSGYIRGTKNWRYELENKIPKYKWVDVYIDGVRHAKQVLVSPDEIQGREGESVGSR